MTSLTKLKQDYDRLNALRKGLATELALDTTGEVRQGRVEAIAAAARAGDPLPEVRLDRAKRSLELEGVEYAIRGVAVDIAELLAEGRARKPKNVHLDLPPTADQLVEHITTRYDQADVGARRTEDDLAERRRYEAALEDFNTRRAEYVMSGVDPAAATDRVKADMGDQVDDLFMKNSPGDLRLTGRTIGEGLTSTAPIGVPA